jgi:hypothetical protein
VPHHKHGFETVREVARQAHAAEASKRLLRDADIRLTALSDNALRHLVDGVQHAAWSSTKILPGHT